MGLSTAKFTERLELQELAISGNTWGEAIEQWTTFLVIYASSTAQHGSLTTKENIQLFQDGESFICRYTKLAKKGTRVLYNGKPYKITNSTTVPRNQYTIIDLVIWT